MFAWANPSPHLSKCSLLAVPSEVSIYSLLAERVPLLGGHPRLRFTEAMCNEQQPRRSGRKLHMPQASRLESGGLRQQGPSLSKLFSPWKILFILSLYATEESEAQGTRWALRHTPTPAGGLVPLSCGLSHSRTVSETTRGHYRKILCTEQDPVNKFQQVRTHSDRKP